MDAPNKIQQLSAAIAALDSQRSILGDAVVDSSIAALRKEITALRPDFSKERKLVSILFCDIVDSSKMAAERDPEEVLNIVNGALLEMNQAVETFGGTVTRYMGDGILAVFGAPKAQERHAAQAIRAGLSIQERIKAYGLRLSEDFGLSEFMVRVGINSGHVVGGGIGGDRGEYTVIGDAANMAARFEASAPPGGILIGESTFQLAGVERFFDTQAWGPITVKGSAQPQRVHLVMRALALPRLQVKSDVPLTGREAELSMLQASFERVAAQHKAEIIRVTGPAGIGKSRLRQEFVSWLISLVPSPQVTLGSALTHTGSTPYALASSLLNASLEIVETDTMDQRREKIKNECETLGEISKEHLHGLAALASIEWEDSVLEGLEPQARRTVLFESFIAYWKYQAQRAPLVLILEDSHWADALSLDLVDELLGALPTAPILLALFTRPDPVQDRQYAEMRARHGNVAFLEISLQELDSGQTSQLVQGLLASAAVPPELIRTVELKAQGNPFFVEEIINSLLEDGILTRQWDGWELTRELADIQVPDTVQDVLAARIDRLDADAKQTLQHAAIIGRSFSQQVLTDLMDRETGEALEKLGEREFVENMGRVAAAIDDWEWFFRHVLVQEVAYESVLVEVRRTLHRRIASYLESSTPDRLDELAPTLALHFERGNSWDRAVAYLLRAAERAARVFALREALSFYDRAVKMAESHPEDIPHETLLEVFEKRGDVRALAYEFSGAEADFRIGLDAARTSGSRVREQSLLVRLGFLFRTADRLEEAIKYLKAGLEVARQEGDLRAVADTLYHLGTVAWTEGDNDTALGYQQEAVEICRRLEIHDLVAVQALHGLAEAQQWSARAEPAVDNYLESIQLARQIGDRSYESENLYMLAYACSGDRGIGNYDLGRRSVEEALKISREARMDGHTAPALLVAGTIYGGIGDYQQSFELMVEAIAWSENLGIIRFQTQAYYNLCQLYREINLYDKAREVAARGLRIATEHQIGFNLLSLQAEVAIAQLFLGDLGVKQQLLDSYEKARPQGQWVHGLRCLEGLSEWALAAGETQATLVYSHKMGDLAGAGGLREKVARSRMYQGQAFTQLGDFGGAETEFNAVSAIADQIGGIRLQWDVHAALEKLYRLWGQADRAEEQRTRVKAIVSRIRENLQDDDLKAGLPDF